MKKLSIGLSADDLASLQHIARERGVPVAGFVRAALRREIAGYACAAVTGRPRLRVIHGGQSGTPGHEVAVKWPLRGSKRA